MQKYTLFSFLNKNIIYPLNIDESIDEIYHLACPASPKYYQLNDKFTLDTCYKGTQNISELSHKKNAKILFSWTSEIYGVPLEHPQTEEYKGNVNTFGPRSCYDEGKRVAETLMYVYKNYGVDIRIVRIFNTYGPHMRLNDGRVITNFISQAINNIPITIYGDGKQTRSFCYVDDTVDALLKMLEIDNFGPFNIGNPNEITIRDLSKLIIKLTNSKSEVSFKNLPQDDPLKRKPDISKAKDVLNWEPHIDLEEGLNRTIDYFKSWII